MAAWVLSFSPPSFANFYQNRTKIEPKSTTNETKLVQGGVNGQPKIDQNMKKYKKRKRKKAKYEKTLFLKSGAIFSKIGGLNGWAFTEVFSTNVIKMTFKT